MHEKPLVMNKVFLMKRMFNWQMNESSPVEDHINNFNVIMTQLNSILIVICDVVKAL